MDFLSPERALIFRITHHSNLPWILRNGVHCRNSATFDPNFTEIGRPEIISRRTTRVVDVPPGGTLSDYVPFYFNSKTPMLCNIKTGWQGLQQRPMNDIVILVTSLRDLAEMNIPFVYSDRNATLVTADFMTDLADLHRLPWDLWRADNFKGDESRPDKIERYHSEALVHHSLPTEAIKAILCFTPTRKTEVEKLVAEANLQIPVHCRPGWYC